MWKETAKKVLQGWSQNLRSRIRTPPLVKNGPLKSEFEKGLVKSDYSSRYQEAAKAILDNFQRNVKSSPSYASAKEKLSKLRPTSSQNAADISKRLPEDLRTQSEWKDMAEPAKRAMKESIQSASLQVSRLAKERIAEPAQQALKESAEKATKVIQSASDRVVSRASQLAQERIADPAQKILEQSSQSAQRVLEESTRRATQSAKSAASQASSAANQMAQSGKQALLEELSSMRSDALRWFWWWSLAAIAVYGIATTLPGELLRIKYEQARQNNRKTLEEKENQVTKKVEGVEDEKQGIASWISSSWSFWLQNGQESDPSEVSKPTSSRWALFNSSSVESNKSTAEDERSSFERLFVDGKEGTVVAGQGSKWWSWSPRDPAQR